jgi:hypothetical protein
MGGITLFHQRRNNGNSGSLAEVRPLLIGNLLGIPPRLVLQGEEEIEKLEIGN